MLSCWSVVVVVKFANRDDKAVTPPLFLSLAPFCCFSAILAAASGTKWTLPDARSCACKDSWARKLSLLLNSLVQYSQRIRIARWLLWREVG